MNPAPALVAIPECDYYVWDWPTHTTRATPHPAQPPRHTHTTHKNNAGPSVRSLPRGTFVCPLSSLPY